MTVVTCESEPSLRPSGGLRPLNEVQTISVKEEAPSSEGSPAGTVQASRPFSSSVDGPIAYFEAAIRKWVPTGAIGVGLARAGYAKNQMPGWKPVSYAWHGDDGKTFANGASPGTPLSTPWQEGDVIGCGIDFRRAAIFFTRNGLLQPGSLRGVDTEGLLATLGFDSKGQCVSVSFGPNFVYDLSSYDLAPLQIPVHRIRYLDGQNEEKLVNLLAREYMIVEMPVRSKYSEALRCALCLFKAENSPQAVRSALLGLWKWMKPFVEASASSGPVVLPPPVADAVVRHQHGEALLAALGLAKTDDSSNVWSWARVEEPAAIVSEFAYVEVDDVAEGQTCSPPRHVVQRKETEAACDQTVLIVIPEGFPADTFFEEVEENLREALSAADPLVAPASGQIGDQYTWPDRGYDHEESWYESLTAALTEGQSGAIARGQTHYEADTLVARLSNVVQCRVITDNTHDYKQRAHDAKRSQEGDGWGLCEGDRVQVSTGDEEWKLGNILLLSVELSQEEREARDRMRRMQSETGSLWSQMFDAEQGERQERLPVMIPSAALHRRQCYIVICDDGTLLHSVPQDHIKSRRGSGRDWSPRGGIPTEMQKLMMRDHRMIEQIFSFETGDPQDRQMPVFRKFRNLQQQPALAWRVGLAIGFALRAGDVHVLRGLACRLQGIRADAEEVASRAEILAAGGNDLHVAAAGGRPQDAYRALKMLEKYKVKSTGDVTFEVGDAVKLVEGYEGIPNHNVAGGPLAPDDVGTVVAADHPSSPGYAEVEANGQRYWYLRSVLMLAVTASDPLDGIDQMVFSGHTALHLAALRFTGIGHLQVLETLIQHGARMCRTRQEGLSPLHCLLRSPAALAQKKPSNTFLKAVDLLSPASETKEMTSCVLEAVNFHCLQHTAGGDPLTNCRNAILVADLLLDKLLAEQELKGLSIKSTKEASLACKLAVRMHQDAPFPYLRHAAGRVAGRLLAISNVQEVVRSGERFCRMEPSDIFEGGVPASVSLFAIGVAHNAGQVASNVTFVRPFQGVRTDMSFDSLLKQGWKVHYQVSEDSTSTHTHTHTHTRSHTHTADMDQYRGIHHADKHMHTHRRPTHHRPRQKTWTREGGSGCWWLRETRPLALWFLLLAPRGKTSCNQRRGTQKSTSPTECIGIACQICRLASPRIPTCSWAPSTQVTSRGTTG